MPLFGSVSLAVSFAAILISIICLFLAVRESQKLMAHSKSEAGTLSSGRTKLQIAGFLGVWLSTLTLTVCCLILVVAFLTGDNSIAYVVSHRSDSSSDLAVLYKISGLWAGREGSLLFWAWLISVFNALVALVAWKRNGRQQASVAKEAAVASTEAIGASTEATVTSADKAVASTKATGSSTTKAVTSADKAGTSTESTGSSADKTVTTTSKKTASKNPALDYAALAISQIVLLAFVSLLTFDESNRPFIALAAEYLDASGALTGNATLWGMNTLLEHWAMAIHPPTLFVGYAGFTIPFAYALAALIVNDSSRAWVDRSNRYALFSWLFLGIGIGLGAIWAYVVLGWGGYWGWDPVENASLLAWIVGVGLVHSMTMYRQRGTFKRWTIMLACLTFVFVIVGTFISRSGIVESVHAFSSNAVSVALFGALIILPLIASIVGLVIRRKSFADAITESDEAESIMSKDVAYYLNNVIMLVCTIFLAYMTISSALPTWMPFGGQGLGAVAYNSIARPVGILYCLIIAVCPLLAWKKTSAKAFFRQAWLPALLALVLFAGLCAYFATTLLPTYMQTMAQGGNAAQELIEAGPFWFYAGLTLVGFLAASLLFFNSLVMLIRALVKRNIRVQTIGGFLSHLSMGILLIGLIGSSMYVSERTGYMEYDEETDVAAQSFVVKNYELTYVSNTIEQDPNGNDILYTVSFDVEKDGVYIGQVSPSVQFVQSTQQQKLNADVISSPTEDLFVVYRGVNEAGSFSLDVRVNPLISFVWIGFGLLMLGTAIAALGRRKQ